MTTRETLRPACRAFEERLIRALDAEERGRGPLLANDAHGQACPDCAALAFLVAENLSILASLKQPSLSDDLDVSLRRISQATAPWVEASEIVALLDSGVLAHPAYSAEFRQRLLALGESRRTARRRGLAAVPAPAGSRRDARPRAWDWRIGVALAYAATLLLVAILKVDPLSVARGAASDLTAAGERAIAEARDSAAEKLRESRLVRAAGPLTEQFSYRVYRTVAVGRARAAAYVGLVFERVFGQREEDVVRRETPSTPVLREPNGANLRS